MRTRPCSEAVALRLLAKAAAETNSPCAASKRMRAQASDSIVRHGWPVRSRSSETSSGSAWSRHTCAACCGLPIPAKWETSNPETYLDKLSERIPRTSSWVLTRNRVTASLPCCSSISSALTAIAAASISVQMARSSDRPFSIRGSSVLSLLRSRSSSIFTASPHTERHGSEEKCSRVTRRARA